MERRIETSRSLFRIPTVLCLHANTLKVRFVLIYCEFENRFFFCCCCWNLKNPSACSFHTTRTSHKCLIAFNSDHNRKRNGTGIRVEESHLIETDNSCWWWKQRSCDLFIFWCLKSRCQWDQLGRSRWELNETVFVAISLDPVGRRLFARYLLSVTILMWTKWFRIVVVTEFS